MDKKIKDAFAQVKADEELINSTKSKLHELRLKNEFPGNNTDSSQSKARSRLVFRKTFKPVLRLAAAILLVFVIAGSGIYHYQINAKAVSYISIDAAPSIELSLNKNDKVVSADAYNEEGQKILNEVDIKGESYQDAIETIMKSHAMQSCLSADDTPSFTIISDTSEKCSELEKGVDNCESARSHHSTSCIADKGIYETAHTNNLSFGKYELYLKLSEYDDSLTTEDCHHMSACDMESELHCHEAGAAGENESCEEDACEEDTSDESEHSESSEHSDNSKHSESSKHSEKSEHSGSHHGE